MWFKLFYNLKSADFLWFAKDLQLLKKLINIMVVNSLKKIVIIKIVCGIEMKQKLYTICKNAVRGKLLKHFLSSCNLFPAWNGLICELSAASQQKWWIDAQTIKHHRNEVLRTFFVPKRRSAGQDHYTGTNGCS